MIPHLLAAPTSLHLGKESKLSLRSTFGTLVEKYVKEVQWTSDNVSGEYNANLFKGNHRNVVPFFCFGGHSLTSVDIPHDPLGNVMPRKRNNSGAQASCLQKDFSSDLTPPAQKNSPHVIFPYSQTL